MGQEWGIAYGKRASQVNMTRNVNNNTVGNTHQSAIEMQVKSKIVWVLFRVFLSSFYFCLFILRYLAIAHILITNKLPPRQADKDKNLKRSAHMDLGSRMNDTHVHYDTIPHSWTIFNGLLLVVSAAPRPNCNGWGIAYGCQFKKEWRGHPDKNSLYDKLFSEADKIRRQDSKRGPWVNDVENGGIKKRDYRGMN
ncbi:unnamed protein product [Porites evermanni]|uniref:Uncharacterized protein n=1 Tax=Porites evermanni TaxID=104178 RepID=A0ABN8SUC5_9CNID|nr:unnamed protein product [Porites evermanni]